jgi:hypothetical protein
MFIQEEVHALFGETIKIKGIESHGIPCFFIIYEYYVEKRLIMKKYVFVILCLVVSVLMKKKKKKGLCYSFLRVLWSNIKSISTILYTVTPFVLLLAFILLILSNKWSFRVEKMSIGGLNVIFDNPTKLFIKHIKNYLDTKRTIFVLKNNIDNYKETLDSYYEVYKFIREEIKILGDAERKRLWNKETSNLYDLTNQAILILNAFLTENQSDYRRWYTFMEKHKEEEFYLMPIGDFQKKYPRYADICDGFIKVNQFFSDKIAKAFEVDIQKWDFINTNELS